MDEKIKPLVQLAHECGSIGDRFERAVRSFIDQSNALDGEEFWPLVDRLATLISRNLKSSRTAINEFVRSALFDQKHSASIRDQDRREHWAEIMLGSWVRLVEFVRAYRKVKVGLRRATQDWPDLDKSDDSFGDFIDALPLGGKTRTQLICGGIDGKGRIENYQQLGVNLFTFPLEQFIMNGENYVESTLTDALIEYLPSIARDFFADPRSEKLEKDPEPRVERCMDLEAIVAALAPVMEKTTRPFPGLVQINLTTTEYAALRDIASMFKLADLVNYKRAQDSYPRLLNAVKLVLSIADNPTLNPTEQISLAPKTRAQLDSAVKFAEK